MEGRQLQYLIKAIDQASGTIAKVSAEMEKLEQKNTGVGSSGVAAGGNLMKMTGAMGAAILASGALIAGMQVLGNELDKSVKAAKEYDSAFIGLSSVAAAFGEDQEKARKAAQDLASDGLMPVADAAQGLKNLLGSKFNLDESINLMKAFKDAAAFNRQGTLDFGVAIVGATQGIKNQNSIMVDNVGITKNLSIILREAGYSVNDLQNVTTNAGVRQALYNGLLREGAVFAGDAARYADTLAGSYSRLDYETQLLHKNIGEALAPAIVLLNSSMTDAANSANGSLVPAMDNIARGFLMAAEVAVVAGIQIKTALIGAAQAGIGIAKGMMDLNAMNFKGAADSFTSMVTDVGKTFQDGASDIDHVKDKTQQLLDQISTKGVGSFGNVARDAMDKTAGAVDSGGSKIASKLQQIQDKIADINRNITKEVTEFTRNLANATADFDRQIQDLVVQHRQTQADLRQQLADLNNDYNDADKDRLSAHADRVTQIKDKYAEETKTLEDNLKKQVIGSKTSDAQLKAFLEKKLKETQDKRDAEVAKEQTDFEKQEAKEKANYDKQATALQKKLDAEMEIEKKHQDEFNKFKDAVAEDDITRAEQQFSRQMDQMKYQHDQRMAELERQLQEEEALKNKYMGTNVTTGQSYKSSGVSNPAATKAAPSKTYATVTPRDQINQVINFTQNNNNVPNSAAALNKSLGILGWAVK